MGRRFGPKQWKMEFLVGWVLFGLMLLPGNAFSFGPGSLPTRRVTIRQGLFPNNSIKKSQISRIIRVRKVSLEAIVLPEGDERTTHCSVAESVPKTLSEALYTFLAGPYAGPRITLAIVLTAIAYRLSLPMTLMDPLLFMGAVVFWWFQEHAMHKHLLHSDFDWYGKRIHEVHHQKNYFHVSLDPAPLMVGWLATVYVLVRWALPLPWALTTTIGYAAAGIFYEWSHYIVHTRVRFAKGTYWQRMKDHHIRHHLVNADNWLGFSLPQVDDFFGTNPDVRSFRKQGEDRELL